LLGLVIPGMTNSDKNLRLYKLAVQAAYDAVGKQVFEFQPVVIQRALIAEQILTLVDSQDEAVSDARVRQMVSGLNAYNSQWTGPMTSRWAL
jgi:hypothetical protein